MEYSKQQLDFIQKKLLENIDRVIAYHIWISHANLAGFNVETDTGKMFKQKDNVRTYYQ